MKQFTYTKWIVAALAISLFCCSCAKDKDGDATTRSKKPTAEITSDEPSSDTQTWFSTPSDQSDDLADPDNQVENLSNKENQGCDSGALGTANMSNGGFATGDDQSLYYVTYISKERISIVKEDRSSGTKTPVYTTAPKDEPIVDSLNVVGDTLYFRENQSEKESFILVKLNLKDDSIEVLNDAEIASFTVYKDHLYYAENNDLVRTDLDGKNKTVLYSSEHSVVPSKIAYCFTDNKIFFATTGESEKDGFFFGKLCSMDPDGNNRKEIPIDADVCNSEVFMSDGEMLYFYGNSEKDGMGIYSCRLDGSELTKGDISTPRSMNFIAGRYVMATDAEIFLKKDSTGYELIESGNIRWAKIVIVGNDLYYYNYDAKDENSVPVMTRTSILGGKTENLEL